VPLAAPIRVTEEVLRPALSPAAVEGWRAFGARRYRSFRWLSVAQGFIGALSGPALVIPLLLALGAHPALASAVAVLPVVGTTVQRYVPSLLSRSEGNFRGIVLLATTVGEPRGLLLALIVALAAGGAIPAPLAIGLIAIVVGTLGALGAVGYGLLQSWYQIVLPDGERRLVAPRLGGIALGIGAVVLLPLAITIDGLVAQIGLWAFVPPLVLAGVAGLVASVTIRALPQPGRVRVPQQPVGQVPDEHRLRRFARVITLASLGAGLSPFLAIYAIAILGTGPGFAIAISAVSSATLVLTSLFVSSRLLGGSSSRMLRASFLLRGAALLLGVAAHPAVPIAPLVLLVVAVLLAAGDTAGQLSANERLFRLATGPTVIAFQSRFVTRYVAAYSGGLLAGSAVMLLGGYPAFLILFVAAAATRFTAAWQTEVSPRTVILAAPPRVADAEIGEAAEAAG
jgi:hypothetical protein